ncbi:MAG: hypothetical protein JXR57_15400 [Bacteroidales bacterium]|nr:hypothetical protein [Bacteroidales bacterium]
MSLPRILIRYSALILLLPLVVSAQQHSIGESVILSVVDSARKGTRFEPNLKNLTEKDLDMAISSALRFANDTSFEVKWSIAVTADKIFWLTKSKGAQQSVAAIMVLYMWDENSRLSYLADQLVMRYPYIVFGEKEKALIAKLAEQTSRPIRTVELYKLCARIKAKEVIPELQDKAYDSNTAFRIKWAALVSLTRLGDKQAEAEMIKTAREFPLTVDAVNTLFPDIIFSRSHRAINLLIRQVQVNNGTCESLSPSGKKGVPCAYMILRVLAPHIKGLNWHGEKGLESLNADDALKKARSFFKSKGDSWELTDEV